MFKEVHIPLFCCHCISEMDAVCQPFLIRSVLVINVVLSNINLQFHNLELSALFSKNLVMNRVAKEFHFVTPLSVFLSYAFFSTISSKSLLFNMLFLTLMFFILCWFYILNFSSYNIVISGKYFCIWMKFYLL